MISDRALSKQKSELLRQCLSLTPNSTPNARRYSDAVHDDDLEPRLQPCSAAFGTAEATSTSRKEPVLSAALGY